MPYGKAYTREHMESVSKAGEMNPVPEEILFRVPLETDIIGPTQPSVMKTEDQRVANVPTTSSGATMEKQIFALANDYSIYDTSGK